jgi:hypothetical protein
MMDCSLFCALFKLVNEFMMEQSIPMAPKTFAMNSLLHELHGIEVNQPGKQRLLNSAFNMYLKSCKTV